MPHQFYTLCFDMCITIVSQFSNNLGWPWEKRTTWPPWPPGTQCKLFAAWISQHLRVRIKEISEPKKQISVNRVILKFQNSYFFFFFFSPIQNMGLFRLEEQGNHSNLKGIFQREWLTHYFESFDACDFSKLGYIKGTF